ncbi:MAG: hypothetical protein HFH08_06870 [Bacilli bacterium]|nr:hypothetical protein [Bacilli bacterium]
MDYKAWIFPILLMLLLGGYYFGRQIIIIFSLKTNKQKIIYWGILYFLLTILLIRRSNLCIWIGYAIFFYILVDIIQLIFKVFHKEKIIRKFYCKGIPILLFSFMIMVYGIYCANHPIIKKYQVELPIYSNYTIGMISDLHLGTIHGNKVLDEIVEKANGFNIDLFIMAGDIFDEHTSVELRQEAYRKLSKIKTKYGIYYVEGNHDLLTQEVMEGFSNNGIQVLSDDIVLVNKQFYLVGRKDNSRERLGASREELGSLLQNIDVSYPIILVDHQPLDRVQAYDLGVGLHLSGHTHAGQIFPLNFLLEYGYQEKNHYHSIVSSGYGVWGFSFRTARNSEMVLIDIIKKEK